MSFLNSGLWADTCEIPATLARTLDEAVGFNEAAAVVGADGIRRLVVTGNGASYYVAMALWLASLEGSKGPFEVVAVPAGLVATGRFRWCPGDAVLAVSASGEFRDVIEAVESSVPRPFVLVTSSPESTLGRLCDVLVRVHIVPQRAVTHTFAFTGAVMACLAVWARVSQDGELRAAVAGAPEVAAAAIAQTVAWAEATFDGLAVPGTAMCLGEGPAWAAALESALLIKEVARLGCEGVEVREGVTSTLTGMPPGSLAIALPTAGDPFIAEARQLCERQGLRWVEAPGAELADPRLATITAFPAGAALSAHFAGLAGHDSDRPTWVSSYYSTARR